MWSLILVMHTQLGQNQLFREGISQASDGKVGLLDGRIQAADRGFYCTLRKREEAVGDVRRCKVVDALSVHWQLKLFKQLVQELDQARVWRWLLVSVSRNVDRYGRQFDALEDRFVLQYGVQP